MAPLVGILLALAVSTLAYVTRLDRDRAFYPVLVMVVASYYVLFAAIDGSPRVILIESLIAVTFVILALIGFKGHLWLVAVALAAHGILDGFHARLIVNTGAPVWWPGFCGTYDVTAALVLTWLLARARRPSASAASSLVLESAP